MNHKLFALLSCLMLAAFASVGHAQSAPAGTTSTCTTTSSSGTSASLLCEDFTGASTVNNWFFYNGACLTASTAGASSSPGNVPGCEAIKSSYYGQNLTGGYNGVSGSGDTLPDPVGNGALRFTNGSPGGYGQNGAVISALPYSTANGLNITFKTVTYRGDSGQNGGGGNNTTAGSPGYGLPISVQDGADGMSFFLLNGSNAPSGVGSWGGSLGYTCSNSNPNYTGMPNAYLGLGIDEFGNFLNPGDNTASGPGLQANRIGLRGAGNINFNGLTTNSNATYAAYYPASLASMSATLPNGGTGTVADWAVYDTCRTGMYWDYSKVTSSADLAANKVETSIPVPDYPALPNAYSVLSGVTIANEYSNGGYSRQLASPIYYRLKITPSGLLSLQYSYNGGAFTSVLLNQSLTVLQNQGSGTNVTLPGSLYFGFGGSTGGSTNIHEILCFQAAPDTVSASSATANQRQAAQLNSTTQAFFAFYDPNDWTGRVTANKLGFDPSGSTPTTLLVSAAPTWDAACVLNGNTATTPTCPTTSSAEAPANRQILSWDGSKGVGFEYGSLNSQQQLVTQLNVDYLRGVRANEIKPDGSGLFRDRDSVLADIIDSSPVWVGPPLAPYPKVWRDRAHPSSILTNPYPENSGQSYATYSTAVEQARPNVVYVGANDGMLHGFRAGSVDATGTLTGAVPNDGYEVMAYVPGSVLASNPSSRALTAAGANNCGAGSPYFFINALPLEVQNIHGLMQADGSAPACTQPALDYSNAQYGHDYFVDGTPGSGDLFYNGSWHTWLVGGMGYGGSAIYALDVTDPTQFSEGNASKLVLGEWTPSTIVCQNDAQCGTKLGQVSGPPSIKRLHDGQWGIIFGNGLNSQSGDAGIFVMVIPSTGVTIPISPTIFYFSTGTTNNGIAAASPADLDGDSITDYVYAGDLQGNVWRFDLTDVSESNWKLSSTTPLFETGGQPITTQLVVAAGAAGQSAPQVMVAFGTGQKLPQTNTQAASYVSSGQSLYGFWDWNMQAWNTLNPATVYASMAATSEKSCVSSGFLTPSNVTSQTVVINSNNNRDIAVNASILWPTVTSCSSSTTSWGWSLALPGNEEQIIYNPQLIGSAFQVNSIVPFVGGLLSCALTVDQGFSYAVSVLTGGAIPQFFQNYTNDVSGTAAGIQTNATGSAAVVNTSQASDQQSTTWLVYQTTNGTPSTQKIQPVNNVTGQRVTWKQLR